MAKYAKIKLSKFEEFLRTGLKNSYRTATVGYVPTLKAKKSSLNTAEYLFLTDLSIKNICSATFVFHAFGMDFLLSDMNITFLKEVCYGKQNICNQHYC
jgi:hypothetical protein